MQTTEPQDGGRKMKRSSLARGIVRASALGCVAALAVACGSGSSGTTSGGKTHAGGNNTASTSSSAGSGKTPNVAFFGFSAANSFAQATYKGVKKAAKEHNGTAHFFNGDFKASTQVHQLQDAMATGKYNVFVVQANDGTAVVPQVQKAVQDGIAVVAEFTQVGTNYKTVAPQVSGEVSVVENTVGNGTDLGKLAIKACGTMNPCNVVYLQGDPSLPLDVARTKAVVAKLSTDKSIHLLGKPVGGYTHAMGHKVAQTVLAAHSNVNVIVGSSQAIEGAQTVLESKHLLSKIKLIGNGGSIQAVKAVKAGKWYATFGIPEVKDGYVATKYAIQKLHGKNPPKGTNSASLGPNDGLWTKPVLAKANYESHYRD